MVLAQLKKNPVPSWLPWVIWSSVVCGFLGVGISIFTLTVWSDTEWVKESLLDSLEQTLGGPIQIETLNLDLFPSPRIYVEGLTLETQAPNKIAFKTSRIEAGIGWQSLWERRLLINYIMMEEPDLTIGIPLVTTEEPMTGPFPAIHELAIHNGELHLFRMSATQATSALNWETIQLTISQAKTDESSLVRLSAQIPDPQLSSTLTLDGTFTLLEPNETSSSSDEGPSYSCNGNPRPD